MSDEDGGCCGCLVSIGVLIAVGVVLFALIFGVTVGGTHYNCVSCSCDEGLILNDNNRTPTEERVVPDPPVEDI